MPGNTRTGGVLEAMILPALDRGKYLHQAQVAIGERLGCGRHVVDAVAEKDGLQVLVSVKWQQVAGTAEQKVPFRSHLPAGCRSKRTLREGISSAGRGRLEAA